MKLKSKAIEELKGIISADYGVFLTNQEADELGLSLLRITKIVKSVFDRTEINKQKSANL